MISTHRQLIDFINVVHYGGNHGQGKFRFASKVVLRMKDRTYYDDMYGLVDVRCKKDNAKILDNTCMSAIIAGINLIKKSCLKFAR